MASTAKYKLIWVEDVSEPILAYGTWSTPTPGFRPDLALLEEFSRHTPSPRTMWGPGWAMVPVESGESAESAWGEFHP